MRSLHLVNLTDQLSKPVRENVHREVRTSLDVEENEESTFS